MHYPLNPTDKAHWSPQPNIRNAYRTMVPLAADGPWSQALGPTHFSWMFLDDTPKGLPRVTLPDVWFVYRTNPAISFWDTPALGEKMARFPFVVAFAYTRDETNHFADMLLPDATDLESLQLIRIGGTKYHEQFWDHEGFALRQPVVAARGQARDFTDIATELAQRTGLAEKYNAAINKGAGGVPLKGEHGDFSLDPPAPRTAASRSGTRSAAPPAPRSATARRRTAWTGGRSTAWRPSPSRGATGTCCRRWQRSGLRFELPYQERLMRVGAELGRRLHEHDMHWWDTQLKEYQALPVWKDFPGLWEAGHRRRPAAARRTTRSGCSPRAACSTPGAPTSACS